MIKFRSRKPSLQVPRTLGENSIPSSELIFSKRFSNQSSEIKLFKDNLRGKWRSATRRCIEPWNKSGTALFPPKILYISRRKVSTANSLIPRLIHENVWSSASRPLLHPLIRRVKLPAVTTKRRKGSLSPSLSLFLSLSSLFFSSFFKFVYNDREESWKFEYRLARSTLKIVNNSKSKICYI